ncbi:substrate-binding periplasmic protein [Chitinolyticbacter meiyuanensis]|uniref:substrate-binding periplasmic protein n=1 Tax=Chitinolyticbacter meiyuanensis TaxID=682798 RepID=UPI0011E5CC2E|nr:hypothetical protein [Chitinolyticbacter meiyuanensis]
MTLRSLLLAWALIWPATCSAGQYLIAVEALDFSPFYDGAGREYRGYARDLLDAFSRRYHHRFTYVALPVERLYLEFYSKRRYDFKFPDNPRWQTALKAGLTPRYSAPAVTVTESLMVRPAQRDIGFNQIDTIATVRGFSAWPFRSDPWLKIVYADSTESLVNMLLGGRVDGIFFAEDSITHYLARTGRHGLAVRADRITHYHPEFSLATLKHPEVIEQFNAFLAEEQTLIQSLQAKYGIHADNWHAHPPLLVP